MMGGGAVAKKRRKQMTVKQACICLLAVLFSVAYLILMSERLTPESGTVELHFIDVGQGDSSFIVSENGAVLIDTGLREYADTLISYIRRYTDTIDYFIVTHPDADHMGGAADVIERLDVRNVIMTDCFATTATFDRFLSALEHSDINVIFADAGKTFEVGGFTLSLLAPFGKYDPEISENDHSVVVKMKYGDFSALFVGDAEAYEESVMLDSYSDHVLKSDVLKVAHHGSKSSSSERFISAVRPSLAVISCGKNNEYGHPHKLVLAMLAKYGADVVRTDQSGTAVVVTDGKGYYIK